MLKDAVFFFNREKHKAIGAEITIGRFAFNAFIPLGSYRKSGKLGFGKVDDLQDLTRTWFVDLVFLRSSFSLEYPLSKFF